MKSTIAGLRKRFRLRKPKYDNKTDAIVFSNGISIIPRVNHSTFHYTEEDLREIIFRVQQRKSFFESEQRYRAVLLNYREALKLLRRKRKTHAKG